MLSLTYRQPRLVALIMTVLVAAGLSAFLSIGRQEDPTITNLFATVTTTFPGADPARVEALVTSEIEEELREIFDDPPFLGVGGRAFGQRSEPLQTFGGVLGPFQRAPVRIPDDGAFDEDRPCPRRRADRGDDGEDADRPWGGFGSGEGHRRGLHMLIVRRRCPPKDHHPLNALAKRFTKP